MVTHLTGIPGLNVGLSLQLQGQQTQEPQHDVTAPAIEGRTQVPADWKGARQGAHPEWEGS